MLPIFINLKYNLPAKRIITNNIFIRLYLTQKIKNLFLLLLKQYIINLTVFENNLNKYEENVL